MDGRCRGLMIGGCLCLYSCPLGRYHLRPGRVVFLFSEKLMKPKKKTRQEFLFLRHVEECQGVVDVDVISVLLDKNHPLSPEVGWFSGHFSANIRQKWRSNNGWGLVWMPLLWQRIGGSCWSDRRAKWSNFSKQKWCRTLCSLCGMFIEGVFVPLSPKFCFCWLTCTWQPFFLLGLLYPQQQLNVDSNRSFPANRLSTYSFRLQLENPIPFASQDVWSLPTGTPKNSELVYRYTLPSLLKQSHVFSQLPKRRTNSNDFAAGLHKKKVSPHQSLSQSVKKRMAWSLAWSRKICLIQKLIFKRKVLDQICPFIFTIFVILSRGHIEHFFCPSFVWVWFFEAAPFMLDSTSFRSLKFRTIDTTGNLHNNTCFLFRKKGGYVRLKHHN